MQQEGVSGTFFPVSFAAALDLQFNVGFDHCKDLEPVLWIRDDAVLLSCPSDLFTESSQPCLLLMNMTDPTNCQFQPKDECSCNRGGTSERLPVRVTL